MLKERAREALRMLTMAVGQSDDVDPAEAIAQVIDQCRAQLQGRQPRAGILFSAIDIFDPSLVELVRSAFGGIDVVGSTSVAEMTSTHGYLEDSITLALFSSDDVDIAVGLGMRVDADVLQACRTAIDEALAKVTGEPRVCIVLSEAANAQRVGETLNELLPNVLVVGGGAGRTDISVEGVTYEFCNDRVGAHAVAILVFAGEVSFSTAVGTGWTVLGPTGTVTSADYGLIHEIDGRPAADFLHGYIDANGGGTSGNPLAVRDAGSEDWYLRVVLGADADGTLRIPGGVSVGATVQLTTTSPDQMLIATADAVDRARASFPAGVSPSAALVFSCGVRKFMLGSRSGREVAEAQARLPAELPIVGMYCIGEIAPTGYEPASRYLNETFVTLLLGG